MQKRAALNAGQNRAARCAHVMRFFVPKFARGSGFTAGAAATFFFGAAFATACAARDSTRHPVTTAS